MPSILSYLFILLCTLVSHHACSGQIPLKAPYGEREILVRFQDNVSRIEAESLHQRLGSTLLKHFEAINADLVKIKEGWAVEKAITTYLAEPIVSYAEPNYTRRAQPHIDGEIP
jgi:hypothetical protein